MTDFDHLPAHYVECAGYRKWPRTRWPMPKPAGSRWTTRCGQRPDHRPEAEREIPGPEPPRQAPGPLGAGQGLRHCPTTRRYHPIYESMGGVPAIREVQFSIIQTGAASAGATSAPSSSTRAGGSPAAAPTALWAEAEQMTHEPDFKGYIHDIGGPTANFRFPSCGQQMKKGMCTGGKHCLAPPGLPPSDCGPQGTT